MHIEGLEKVIYFRQKNPIGLAWETSYRATCKPSNTIYLHKCKGKLKYVTAVDLKTTLDPQW